MLSDTEMFFKRARNVLPIDIEDPDYDRWLKENYKHCYYGAWGECSTQLVLDHVLSGYFGAKCCGLLKVVSCIKHNQDAEVNKEMHTGALHEAFLMKLLYDCEKLREKTDLSVRRKEKKKR